MAADAVSPDQAVAFEPNSYVKHRAFARWQRAGVLREAGAGRWYLDVPSYAEAMRGRRRRVLAVGLIGGLVAAGVAMLAH